MDESAKHYYFSRGRLIYYTWKPKDVKAAIVILFNYEIFQPTFNKYKTFSVLIYSYINTRGNWENEKLCGNTTPAGRSVFIQFPVFPISTSVDITVYNIAFVNSER